MSRGEPRGATSREVVGLKVVVVPVEGRPHHELLRAQRLRPPAPFQRELDRLAAERLVWVRQRAALVHARVAHAHRAGLEPRRLQRRADGRRLEAGQVLREVEVDEREAYLSRNPLWRAGYGRPPGEFVPKHIDKRLLRRQALMDSVNEFHWTHPGLVPRKCPPPPRTLGALRFFLRWFDSATSWPLERSNVLETLWSFKDAALDLSALHPVEAERWKVFLEHFPADGHEAMLAFYAGWMEALRAGKPPDPAAMMPPPGLAESIYEEELLCEARVRSTVPGVVPLWYGRPMVDEDPEIAAQAALAREMVGAGQCSLM